MYTKRRLLIRERTCVCFQKLENNILIYKKGFYIHFKFEGNKITLNEIEKKIKIDGSIIRHLIVKYKKLDTKNEFFSKKN